MKVNKRQKTKVFDYKGLEHFGKPASIIADNEKRVMQAQRHIENGDAHCFDALRQSFESEMDWDSVKRLISSGIGLERAKYLVSITQSRIRS